MRPTRALTNGPEPIDGLIFDFDGVLVDSDPLHAEAYRRAFEAHGIRMSLADYVERAKGLGRSEVVALFGAELGPREREDVARIKTLEAQRLIREGGLAPVEAVIPFLRSARARGFACAVASTSEIAGFAVESLGLTALFDCVCAKRPEDRAKPHPDVFLRAIAGLDRTPARCLVVEDTPIGVRAARAAGAQVVVRGCEADWTDGPHAQDVLGYFSCYRALHRAFGWGPLEETGS